MRVDSRHPVKVMLALVTIYMVWGSSFLFTKIAVGSVPPALVSGIRFTTAGILLAAIAHFWRGDPIPRRAAEWRHLLVTGFFMVFISNGLNTWTMQFLASNQSALLNGTSAFWIAGLGVFGPRGHPLTRWAVAGMTLGFTGAALTLIPKGHFSAGSTLAQVGVVIGCLSWSVGTLYYRSIDTTLGPLMFTALQLCVGGLMLFAVSIVHGDLAHWNPGSSGLVALFYLTFCSSCIAYTAYGWLSLHAPPALIGSYGYVNPAIAAFLGWQFLGEKLSAVQIAGMVVIIAGVGLLTLPGGSLTDPKTLAEPKTQ
jgi:drug/metabolite transporter (DMT)-like permease